MIKLQRISDKPILEPIPEHNWESKAVFNCGVYYDGTKVHMLYRASDSWDKTKMVSSLGYAESIDGINFKRKDTPVYQGQGKQEARGCEDPRITKIDNVFYILYTAYSGRETKIAYATTKDFINFERKGILLDDVDNKDAALFPEKIKGKYMLLHRRMPYIWVGQSHDLAEWTDHNIIMETRSEGWEDFKIGIAGPPIKTGSGWLLFYHAADHNKVYRLGVALLDPEDPSRLIKRQIQPILEPELEWEKKGWIPDVVFSCGAV
ncbi:MAG: glycosidase, partial [Spirochaetes bacterium]|nr:glycosidase [Spirochaetota bacterium]